MNNQMKTAIECWLILILVLSASPSQQAYGAEFECWNPNKEEYVFRNQPYMEKLELTNNPFDSGEVLNYIAQKTDTDVRELGHLRDVASWQMTFQSAKRQDGGQYDLVRMDSELQFSLKRKYEHAASTFGGIAYSNSCEERIRVREFSLMPTNNGYEVYGMASGKIYKCLLGERVDGGTRVSMWAGMDVSFSATDSENPNELCQINNEVRTYQGDKVGRGNGWTDLTNRLVGAIWAGVKLDANKLDFIQEVLPSLNGMLIRASELLPSVAESMPTLNLIKDEVEGDFELGLNVDDVSVSGVNNNATFVLNMATVTSPGVIDTGYPALKNFFQCIENLKTGGKEIYTVRTGQSLWEIAESKYGYGDFFHTILNLNQHIEDADSIFPGQEIELPVICPSTNDSTTLVERGESLWSIAEKLNIVNRWPELVELNRRHLRLETDDLIYPGQIVQLPEGVAPMN